MVKSNAPHLNAVKRKRMPSNIMPRLWRNRIAPGKINKARGVSMESMLFLGRFGREERQRLQDALQAVIDNDFVLQAWKDRLHRFEIKAPSRDLWRLAIFREQKRKLLRFTFRLIHAVEGVGFSLFLPLLSLATRVRNGIIIDRPGLIDRCLLLLLRLVDFIERCLHGRRRPDGRELDLLDLKPQPVL